MDEDVAARVQALSSALAKLPDHPGVSWRGTELTPEQLAWYVEGTWLVEPAFTSTTVDVSVDFPGNTRFYVVGRTGKDVSSFSAQPAEKEIVFDRGGLFFVHTHEVDTSGRHVIVLVHAAGEQVDSMPLSLPEDQAQERGWTQEFAAAQAAVPVGERWLNTNSKYAGPIGLPVETRHGRR